MSLIAKDLAFSYPGKDVLKDVTIKLGPGTITGIVGENGSGKSTLLRLLSDELVPSRGTIELRGTLTYVSQELDPVERTIGSLKEEALNEVRAADQALQQVIETFDHDHGNLADLNDAIARHEHLRPWEAEQRLASLLTQFGVEHPDNRTLATLSVGERYRARLACALARRSDVLLLDEPTNHLDDSGIELLTIELRNWPGAVALVTHDRDLLNYTARSILDLDPSMDRRPALYREVDYDGYRRAKADALKVWRRRYHREQRRLAHLAEVLDTSYEGLSDEWRPPKGSRKHRRGTRARIHVKNADRQIEQLKGEAVDIPMPPQPLHFPQLPSQPGEMSDASVISLAIDRPSGRWTALAALRGTTLDIAPGEKILVTGGNGAGKSTLLRAIASDDPGDGVVRRSAVGLRIGVLIQDGLLREPQSVTATGEDECTAEVYRLLAQGQLDPEQVIPAYSLGLLNEDEMARPLIELSTGQRRRFELMRALIAAPHLLIVDEPTNHLSVDLVDDLTAALDATDAAVVIASHDRRLRADLAHWRQLHLN
ncbi:macrolide transport system ATP-binding/permease protein [Micrococcales bacterium KH10]|nr:macrolide transport system ATP-binding/permease protein [Micrococcales bacterium KH10]